MLDRMAYEFYPSVKAFALVSVLMGWRNEGMRPFTGYHKHESATIVKEKMGAERFEEYYKFAFVRNPYDHLVSLYHYIRGTKGHFLYKEVQELAFADFLPLYLSTKPRRQVDFIYDEHLCECLVDHVGRFEHIAEEVAFLADRLDIRGFKGMPHANKSTKRKTTDYRSFYNAELRSLVEAYFSADLERLNYEF